jgi:transcriptional regulator with XRE-family HTH domain
LAGVIRRHRERLKLSPNQLEELSGVRRQTIRNIEKDVEFPSVYVVGRIAAGLGIPCEQLHLDAVRWLKRQPAQCRACNFSCMAHGELPWLNAMRVCYRPKH